MNVHATFIRECNDTKLIKRISPADDYRTWTFFLARGSGYMLERRFTKFSEITQCNGHYAVQGHSRSPILVPIESSYTTSYQWLIPTYLLSCTVSKSWLIIGQIFASERGMPHFDALAGGGADASIAISDISLKTTFFWLHFCRRKYRWYLQPLLRNAPRKLANSVK